MAKITKEEYVEQSYQAFLKNEQLKQLAAQRVAEETALIEEYKVNELNQKRAALIVKYKDLEAPIKAEIEALKSADKK